MKSDNTGPRPPKHLSKAAKIWWKSVVNQYELQSHHLKLLTLAAESWDRCVEARNGIAEHGLTFTDRHGCRKPSPEVAIERDSRIAFARLVRELGIDVMEPDDPPRPPRVGGQR